LRVGFNAGTAAALAATTGALYLFAVLRGLADGALYPASTLESLVMGTMVIRLGAILSAPKLRGSFILGFDILSAELLPVPALMVAFLLTGDATYVQWVRDLFYVWPAAFMAVSPVFSIYKLTSEASRGASLSSVVPSTAGVFVLLTAFDLAVAQSRGVGLEGVTAFAINSFGGVGAPIALQAEATVTGTGALLALLVYALRWRPAGAGQTDAVVGTAMVAALASFGWGLAASSITTNALLVFGAPAIAIVGMIWLASHAQ
jgi:hypothetical protein